MKGAVNCRLKIRPFADLTILRLSVKQMFLAGNEPQGALICHSQGEMRSPRTHFTVYQRSELEKIFRQFKVHLSSETHIIITNTRNFRADHSGKSLS